MKTALVVEDDSALATLVKDALEIAGFRVVVEKDGEAGLRALTKALPDVLVTDLLLPVVPGLELIGKLRSLPKGDAVAVVVMSGIYKSSRHKRTARDQFGVYASLDKPFDVDALVRTVKEAVGLRAPATVVAATPMTMAPEVIVELVRKKADGGDVEKAVRGNLKQRRFPEVLAQVFRFRATGALLLRRGRIKKIVYVKDGLPTFVKSNMLSECLGRVLVREKLITEAECERSVELLPKSRGKLQGQVLIELGALSPQNLTYGLQLQLEQKLYDVFSWPDGDYQFNTKVDFPSEGIGLDVSLANLILEGVRRRYSDTAVVDLLERHIDLYLAPHPEPNHRLVAFDVDSDERTLLGLVDGRRTTREVIEAAGIPVRVARQIVYALIASELATTMRRPTMLATTTPTTMPTTMPSSSSKPPPKPAAVMSTPAAPKPPPRPTTTQPTTAPTATLASTALPTPPPLPAARRREAPPTRPIAATIDDDVLVEGVEVVRTWLLARQRGLRRANHFEALGISRRASLDEAQRAAAAAHKLVQPERIARRIGGGLGIPAELRAVVDQIAQQLSSAADVVTDQRRRADYEARLDQRARGAAAADVHRALVVDSCARRADAAVEAGRHDDAVSAWQAAVAADPDDGELAAALAWAMFQRAPNDGAVQNEVMARLQRAIEQAPRYDNGWLWLGKVLQRAGQPAEAKKQFERALGCNPDNRDAQIALSR